MIGATSPWLPGVAIGHNDRIAWGLTALDADVQDLYVEKVNPANAHQVEERGRWIDTTLVHDSVPVKGAKPFAFDHEFTPRGVIVAVDRGKHLAFTLRWTGAEPGTASELGALALDRARSWPEFRAALARWKMPAEDVVYADVDGNIGHQAAALVPIRRSWNGTLPAPGWTGGFDWSDGARSTKVPHAFNPARATIATANGLARAPTAFASCSRARTSGVDDFKRWQHDTLAWNAERLVPLLARVRAERPEVERARQLLVAWDKRLTADSTAATLYVLWETALLRKVVEGKLERSLAQDYLGRADADAGVVVPALGAGEAVALEALISAVEDGTPGPWRASRRRGAGCTRCSSRIRSA